MKKYIGVKEILAVPMTRLEYNKYRGWVLPENENGDDAGFLVEYVQSEDSPNVNHPDHKGYISWSPVDVFETAYILENCGDVITTENKAPHQVRVVEEYCALLEKSNALLNFFENSFFLTLPADEQLRLRNQSVVMRAYLSILVTRIENF